MKFRAVSGIMLALLFLGMSTLAFDIQVAKGESEPRVYVDPPLNSAPMDTYFTIKIKIANVTNLISWGITLYVNKLVLETNLSMIEEGPFLKQDGAPTMFITNFDFIFWNIGCLITTPSPGVNGSGTLVSITFRVLTEGDSSIVLVETGLLNPALNSIPHTSKDGYFSNVRDIAVRDVVAYPRVSVGEPVFINVTVTNQGNETETFNVTVNYDNIIIGSQTVTSLNPGTSQTLTIIWNTTGVANDTYTISANASVLEGEADTDNNRFVNGKVTLARVRTETVYIRADGSVDPDLAPITSVDNITYALTDNIVTDIPEESSGIVVERENIVIDGGGYTLEGTEAYASKGIDLTGRGNVTIKNMEIKAFSYGIHLDGCSNSIISGNIITNNTKGIYLKNSSNNSIFGNNIKAYNDGIILFFDSNHNTISRNNITGNWYSIALDHSSDNSIYGNNITGNWYSIALDHSSDNSIYGNNIANSWIGVYLYLSSNNTISGNNIKNSSWIGVGLDVSSNNVISGNNIANSDHGMRLYGSSYNTIYCNNFVNNSDHVLSEDSINVWDDGYPSGGNYWSHHLCTGNPSYGSHPYVIDADNVDHYPFQDPNGWLLLEGDVNDDGIVDIIDGVIIGVAFGTKPSDPKWNPHADLNEDGVIDITDIVIWATHFGETH
jgi:parallel beta-helix repeat protein